jgi:predicted RNA-binding protein YlxR (DUF448 family)
MMAAARKGAAKPGARKGHGGGKSAGKGARKSTRPARPDAASDDGETGDAVSGPERRCIVTGQVLPKDRLIRFVAGPDGVVVPDLAAVLPGRGLWVLAERAVVEKAALKGHFAKAARAQVKASPDLAARVEALLVRRMMADLGLARRSGVLVLGSDQVLRALAGKLPPAALIDASDGAADGKRKIRALARGRGWQPVLIVALSSSELSLALGRVNVIHASLKPGRLAERLICDAARLGGFRPQAPVNPADQAHDAPERRV